MSVSRYVVGKITLLSNAFFQDGILNVKTVTVCVIKTKKNFFFADFLHNSSK